MLLVLKVKVHFYLVRPAKYELWLDKRQLNVAFCACDISCSRKMGITLQKYDMPYWTMALSTPHPSNQSQPQMPIILNEHDQSQCVLTLNTLQGPSSAQTCFLCKSSRLDVLTSTHAVNTQVFMCQQGDNSQAAPALRMQTFKQTL